MNTVMTPTIDNAAEVPYPVPGIATLLWRGFTKSCPRCGKAPLFKRFLKNTDQCSVCSQDLGAIRADDFLPYLTMIVVGHIVVPLIVIAEREFDLTITQDLLIWLPVTGALTFWFLPRLKGLIIGLMLHLGLKGDERQ